MKKILFCIHKNSPFYSSIPVSLKELGFKVHIFDYYQSNTQIRLMGLANNILPFDRNRTLINREINNYLIKTAKAIKPDYLLMIKGLHIRNSTIKKIKKLKIICINWFPDLLEFLPWLVKHAAVYDYLFTPDPKVKSKLQKSRIKSYLLPLATMPDPKPTHLSKKYGVAFSGQYTKRREKIFMELAKLGDDFIIWGYPGWKKSRLADHYRGLLPSIDEMLNKFRQAKIVINVQTAEDEFPSEVVSLRVFEATGVGTLLLNWRHKTINAFWRDGKEIVNFTSPKEALELAKYYLSHDKEREKIALGGWQRSAKDHTYVNRLTKMFEIIKTRR